MTMTAATSTTPTTPTAPAAAPRADREPQPAPRLGRNGAVAIAVAAVATSLVAVVAGAADVPLEIEGEEIPAAGFAMSTVALSALGLLLAGALKRWAPRPRATFAWAAAVLTALSFVPSVSADASTATKVVLVATHLVAAAIVVPVVVRALPTRRLRP